MLVTVLMGQFLTRGVCQRLSRWAATTAWKWDDALIDALRRGIPIWSRLFGCYVATGFWQLPEHFLSAFTRALYVLAWLSVTFICAGLVGKLVVLYGSQFQHAMPMTNLTEHIAKIVVIGLGLLMILHGMGISIAPLLTALGVGGLALALALQDTLSNRFAGFYLAVAKHIRVGDYVRFESGQEGSVEDVGWRATKIRMLPNNIALVPNKKLGEAIITNYDLPSRDLAVTVEVGVDYGSDLERVERVTCEVAREVSGGVPEFEPFIRYHTFGDFSSNLTVIFRAQQFVGQFLVKHEFIKRLHARYNREGIVIPDSRSRLSV